MFWCSLAFSVWCWAFSALSLAFGDWCFGCLMCWCLVFGA